MEDKKVPVGEGQMELVLADHTAGPDGSDRRPRSCHASALCLAELFEAPLCVLLLWTRVTHAFRNTVNRTQWSRVRFTVCCSR
jgi:hypothetical protein